MSSSRLSWKSSAFPMSCSFPMDRKVILFPVYGFQISYMVSDSFPLELITGCCLEFPVWNWITLVLLPF